ncbi:uncharacterized protein [Haliotis asinina]|uniref:uncharacterized protein n=1 Tax=Haliotis asinina TaxID=109174 RepID=UPI0035325001
MFAGDPERSGEQKAYFNNTGSICYIYNRRRYDIALEMCCPLKNCSISRVCNFSNTWSTSRFTNYTYSSEKLCQKSSQHKMSTSICSFLFLFFFNRKGKSTFYSWKQVMKMPHTLNEPVITQSREWFQNRQECVKDAKRKFQDDYNVTRRVIVKKSRWALPADEVAMAGKLKLVEDLLTLCYCIHVTKRVKQLSRELCFGCMFDSEGEPVHTCKMSEEEMVEKYFKMALSDVDEGEVQENWSQLMLEDPVLKEVRDFNLVPYRCKDYCDTQFKTSTWADGLKVRVVKMLKLQMRM